MVPVRRLLTSSAHARSMATLRRVMKWVGADKALVEYSLILCLVVLVLIMFVMLLSTR